MVTKQEMGKKSRGAGQRFEVRVRKDLEKKGWIVDKWTNNVSKPFEQEIGEWVRQLEPVKPKFVFNPQIKRRIMIGNSGGFPDFVCFRNFIGDSSDAGNKIINGLSEMVGVESKMNNILDKEEKEKCRWLLNKNIFRKILIASKGEKRGEIKYEEFKNV